MIADIQESIRHAVKGQTSIMPKPPKEIKNRLNKVRRLLVDTTPPDESSAKLLVTESGKKWWVVLRDTTTIGADAENNLRLGCDYISSRHCRLSRDHDLWVLEDTKSANGVFLNGKKISREYPKNGDVIQLGKATLVFINES